MNKKINKKLQINKYKNLMEILHKSIYYHLKGNI